MDVWIVASDGCNPVPPSIFVGMFGSEMGPGYLNTTTSLWVVHVTWDRMVGTPERYPEQLGDQCALPEDPAQGTNRLLPPG